jgi:hypothetical protein
MNALCDPEPTVKVLIALTAE